MKKFSKILSVALLVALVLSLGVTSAFAQTETLNPADDDNASITIGNASKGETYSVVKLFDATIAGDSSDSIAYQGDIPDELAAYFTKDATTGAITATEAAKDSEGNLNATASTALKSWAEDQDAIISAESDGSTLTFDGLPYGYYVVLTTQGAGAVTVTSTNPNATVKDKNSTTITVGKEVDGTSYSIGDTITYTATFGTTNYLNKDANKKVTDAGESTQVYKYVISDTLPAFLSNATVTGLQIVKGDDVLATLPAADYQFGDDNTITIAWVDEDGNSLYANGAQIVLTYTAVLTDVVNVNGENINTVSIMPYDKNNQPWDETWEDTAKITTYAVALQKVDENGNPLAGATFTVKGLTVTKTSDGVYTVNSYNSATSAAESAEMATDENGKLYIVGLKEKLELTVTEVKAPDGYNKLAESFTVTPQNLGETVLYKINGYAKYDADGNLIEYKEEKIEGGQQVEMNLSQLDTNAKQIVNNKGTQLPSTGGIGTTIFYVVGGVLVLAAIILLVTKKRMSE